MKTLVATSFMDCLLEKDPEGTLYIIHRYADFPATRRGKNALFKECIYHFIFEDRLAPITRVCFFSDFNRKIEENIRCMTLTQHSGNKNFADMKTILLFGIGIYEWPCSNFTILEGCPMTFWDSNFFLFSCKSMSFFPPVQTSIKSFQARI